MLNDPMIIDQITEVENGTEEVIKNPTFDFAEIIESDRKNIRYVLGPIDSNMEYTLYLMSKDLNIPLIPIRKYHTALITRALSDLNSFNKAGSHEDIALRLYEIFMSFIRTSLSIEDLIVAIFCTMGYKESHELQLINQVHVGFQEYRQLYYRGTSKDSILLDGRMLQVVQENLREYPIVLDLYINLYKIIISHGTSLRDPENKWSIQDDLDLSHLICNVTDLFK